ncbi:hypothetical protein EVAR_43413_1 [Eumeta japonica]|uniref:Ig-like domain-containing protein n=1 Tax=Eumeta variegata TaxID=151549 RepID=A0A4C1WTC9_EUMVA|nr:hypothetical protein EVAR_43413_1 [Eumeta japonica]
MLRPTGMKNENGPPRLKIGYAIGFEHCRRIGDNFIISFQPALGQHGGIKIQGSLSKIQSRPSPEGSRPYFLIPVLVLSIVTDNYDGRVKDALAHWADESLGGRARWSSLPPSSLRIRDVLPSDQALYRCRVDFKISPTRNYKIALNVIGAILAAIDKKNIESTMNFYSYTSLLFVMWRRMREI